MPLPLRASWLPADPAAATHPLGGGVLVLLRLLDAVAVSLAVLVPAWAWGKGCMLWVGRRRGPDRQAASHSKRRQGCRTVRVPFDQKVQTQRGMTERRCFPAPIWLQWLPPSSSCIAQRAIPYSLAGVVLAAGR